MSENFPKATPKPEQLHNDETSAGTEQRPDRVESEKDEMLRLANSWLDAQKKRNVPYPDIVEAATASREPIPGIIEQNEPVPAVIASEVATLAQQRISLWEKHDLFPDDFGEGLQGIRDEAIAAADQLDFELLEHTHGHDWALATRLNAMHEKFTDVKAEDLARYLGDDDNSYEYKALYIRNIIADHAPELLTANLRVLMDSTQPLWRVASTHASILFRNRFKPKLSTYETDRMPVALPIGNRDKYIPEDDEAMKPVRDMSEDELSLYVLPEFLAEVRARGSVLFKELNLPARETLLARRFFEMSTKSKDPSMKEQAGERNRALEGKSILEEGDFVHATFTPAVLEQVLDHGLQCGEAVVDNDRTQINYPFTVSFLKVDDEVATHETVPGKMQALKNESYGSINLVLHRDASSTDYGREQPVGKYQRQIFGGVPATEIKGVIIREEVAGEDTVEGVIEKIVKNGMFIPVYSASTGDLLLSSQQFDQLRSQADRHDHTQ